jgi:glycosyl hydrolase family 42 (putative beta-galactosidase)
MDIAVGIGQHRPHVVSASGAGVVAPMRRSLASRGPVLDGAHERGIAVLVGTPTYAVPPWLARQYPEIAGERATGQRIRGWRGRRWTSPCAARKPGSKAFGRPFRPIDTACVTWIKQHA